MKSIEEVINKVENFRYKMGLSLSEEDIKYIWGRRYWKELKEKTSKFKRKSENRYVLEKMKICKENISKLLIFDWVQFVGVSGSVGAGFAKQEDDIDVFVVVQNGTMWLYRGLIAFLNLFHNKVRAKRHKDVKDKICVNLICEERGIEFEKDIFNFHELVFLKSVYRENYISYIYSKNKWLKDEYYVKKENFKTKISSKKDASFVIKILNYFAFLFQILFMTVSGHRPNIRRLIDNNKIGKIEFFEYDYKERVTN